LNDILLERRFFLQEAASSIQKVKREEKKVREKERNESSF
jgi:hypothetical protein